MRAPLLLMTLTLAGCGDAGQISGSGYGAFEPALAVHEGGAAVAWHDNRHGSDEIYLRLLDQALRPASAELRLTEDAYTSYEADLAFSGEDLAVAWYDKDAEGVMTVRLGLFGSTGQAHWIKDISSPGSQGRVPVLKAIRNLLFIAWVEDPAEQAPATQPSNVYAAWLNNEGSFATEPFLIGPASSTTWNLNAAVSEDGQVALVYDAEFETRASELYLAKIWQAESWLLPMSEDDGFDSKYPDIALNGSLAALAWFGDEHGNNEVYLALFDILKTTHYEPVTPLDASARRITDTEGDSIGAYLSWNGGTLGLAWNDDEAGQYELYFQTFGLDGEPREAPRRLTETPEASLIPSIRPWEEGFALAWGEVILGAGHGDGGEEAATRSEIFVRSVE